MLKLKLNISIILLLTSNFIYCDESNNNNSNNNNNNVSVLINKNPNKNNDYFYDEDLIDENENDYDSDVDLNYPVNNVLDYPIGGFSVGIIGGGGLQELRRREFAEEILFFVSKDASLIYTANGTSIESMEMMGCDTNENFTVIIHGWREQAETEWIPIMVTNFAKYRGGCVIIVDYGLYAFAPYLRLVQRYDQITSVIYSKMANWQRTGLNLAKVHMFGFSFGARIALAIGKRFGKKTIKSIDACDMAGPGFDIKFGQIDYRNSAENVQCMHTSRDKGTRYYTNCHQNWRIGYCGFNQPGASDPPYGSHGMCPYYYNLAFRYNFVPQKKPDACPARNPARNWPDNFKMGYMENRLGEVKGELFVPVSADPPYIVKNNQKDENDNLLMYGLLPNESVDRIRRYRRRRPIMEQLHKIRRNIMNGRRRFTQALFNF